MIKSPDAFRTISEAADQLDLPQHVLRHWEEVFGHIRPMRRAGGRRYYRTYDIELLNGVRTLLYDERYTTKGVQKIFKENGAQYVAEIGRRALSGEPLEARLNAGEDDVVLGDRGSAVGQEAITADLKDELKQLLAKLESVQDSLDEAILAVDTIAAMDED